MLQAVAPARAVEYFLSVYDQIPNLDEMMQLSVIEVIRKESKAGGSGAQEGSLKVSSSNEPAPLRALADTVPDPKRRRGTSSASLSCSIRAVTPSSTKRRRL